MEQWYEGLQILEHESQPLPPMERLKAINGPLLSWYKGHARMLPWRERPEPYRVWISEIMLQQTRVEAVKPYFARFMEAFPDVKALAEADDERLLKVWEGLGYYNRARNLKKAAGIMAESYGGQLPPSYEELMKLPGIGSYTAGAIASIAYGIRVPAVDGNVLRVISRILASREDILKASVKKKTEKDLMETMPEDRAGEFNQGLMEIGAMVCVPNGQPRCGQCPFSSLCLARKHGLLDSIPYKAQKKPRRVEERTVLLLEYDHEIAIEKRPFGFSVPISQSGRPCRFPYCLPHLKGTGGGDSKDRDGGRGKTYFQSRGMAYEGLPHFIKRKDAGRVLFCGQTGNPDKISPPQRIFGVYKSIKWRIINLEESLWEDCFLS